MTMKIRRLLSIDRVAGRPRLSNRTTPSQNRHINSLPTEILILIFENHCVPQTGVMYGPISLTLVCRLWHAIVTACPALWTAIEFKPCKQLYHRNRAISYSNWSDLEPALKRAGTATLTVKFHACHTLYSHGDGERILRLFDRCRELHISLDGVARFTSASSIIMPHLEHLGLDIDMDVHIEPLLRSIEKGSPLLRSLTIHSFVPTNLARHQSLLRRIVCLNLYSTDLDDTLFQKLQNLEELK
jgi:F-box-like